MGRVGLYIFYSLLIFLVCLLLLLKVHSSLQINKVSTVQNMPPVSLIFKIETKKFLSLTPNSHNTIWAGNKVARTPTKAPDGEARGGRTTLSRTASCTDSFEVMISLKVPDAIQPLMDKTTLF